MLLREFDLVRSEPHNDLLSDRSENEAYCTAISGEAYAVFFPGSGDVSVNFSDHLGGELKIKWLDIMAGKWIFDHRCGGGATNRRLNRMSHFGQGLIDDGHGLADLHFHASSHQPQASANSMPAFGTTNGFIASHLRP